MSASAAPKVLHFVTGGFSGATQVAVDLCLAHQASERFAPLLVLRRKRSTEAARVQALRGLGLDVQLVPGWPHAATVAALARICRRWRPDILAAHGYGEHLLGRWAGWMAGVPHLIHIEHNTRERYTRWSLAQSRWLARRSAAIVGVSEGVRHSLLGQGLPPGKIRAIPNGIDTAVWQAAPPPLAQRSGDIAMVARFARQKDHASLLHALALLRQRGVTPRLQLVGGGKQRWQAKARTLCAQLGLDAQVQFLGVCDNVPALLRNTRVCVLSTHYEGMPLALLEGMAAACAIVGSRVPGVQEIIEHDTNGLLAAPREPQALADALHTALQANAHTQDMADAARAQVLARYSRRRMVADYEALFQSFLG